MKIKIKVSDTFVDKLRLAGFTKKQIKAEAQDIAEFHLLDIGHNDHVIEELIEERLNDAQ